MSIELKYVEDEDEALDFNDALDEKERVLRVELLRVTLFTTLATLDVDFDFDVLLLLFIVLQNTQNCVFCNYIPVR